MKFNHLSRFAATLAVLGLTVISSTAYAADFSPKVGELFSKTFDKVKVHDYVSKTGSAAQVVETDKLVVLDVPGSPEQNADFKAFVDSLGKPVAAVIVSHSHAHHWAGADQMFPGVKIYSAAADAIALEGGMELEQMRKQGAPYDKVPTMEKLNDGSHSFAGVEYQIVTLNDLGAAIIMLPAQHVALVHHLGYADVHVPMMPFDQRLAQLQALEKSGYTWMAGGHGSPRVSKDFVAAVADYYSFVDAAIKNANHVEEAKAAILGKYPNFYSAFLLDIMLPGMMKK